MDGSQVLATAAYNAGPGRLRTWRGVLTKPMESAVFIESIPFFETRVYVKNVMSNATYYAALFEGAPQSLKARIGTVTPRATLRRKNKKPASARARLTGAPHFTDASCRLPNFDPSLEQALASAREPGLTLVIANKNYSSWSMRAWVTMQAFGIPFQEVRVPARPARHRQPHLRLFRLRPRTGAAGWRDDGVGQPGHLRISGRAVPRAASVAAGRGPRAPWPARSAPRCIPVSTTCARRCR